MIDYFIIGQGIAGTMLAYELEQRGKTFCVIDPGKINASRVAAGNINPVTGRHYTKSWMIDDLLDRARISYTGLNNMLSGSYYKEQTIYRTIRSIKEENAWMSRTLDPDYKTYISDTESNKEVDAIINPPLGYGRVSGALRVFTNELIPAYRQYLKAHEGRFIEDTFRFEALVIEEDHIIAHGVKAKNIIFAEGYRAFNNPYFQYLPIEPTKGEVLIVKLPVDSDHNVKDALFLTPWSAGTHWVGSGYEWEFDSIEPSSEGRAKLESKLQHSLRIDYAVEGHIAGIRPCVKDRKPLLGTHHQHKNLHIFNGMGTKGTSLAPYFAHHFINHLVEGTSLLDEVNISRYAHLL